MPTGSDGLLLPVVMGVRVDPGGGGGFEVDPAQLGGVAGQLGTAYDDLGTASADYAGLECYAESDFGDFGMGAAWSAFDGAWAAELGLLSSAVAELIGKVDTTAGNYGANEGTVAGLFGSIGSR